MFLPPVPFYFNPRFRYTGPYLLCWLTPGVRHVHKGSIGALTAAEALEWATGYRDLFPSWAFWLEAWP